ncbi:MAG: N-succinylarginine dihydrolase [Sandaracinaceae bacterium]|nr:N-succinylarginine dihydrolase [Sandaracinaceae bacterium]
MCARPRAGRSRAGSASGVARHRLGRPRPRATAGARAPRVEYCAVVPTSEASFDGLVGPTHNYAGLSYGNVASTSHGGAAASPKQAALQGLAKAKALADLGLVQGILPPHERPHVPTLRRLGFSGTDAQIVERAGAQDPALLAMCSSASAMWTANAATVAPSADTSDGKLHFVPANLVDKAHRSLEPEVTARALKAIFRSEDRFAVHAPLPATPSLGDEGAANHTRLGASLDAPGVHLFVYGREALRSDAPAPARFPARQTLEASRAVARLCALDPSRSVFVQQSPAVIDRGVFHNDVIAVGHGRVLLFHEQAFVQSEALISRLAGAVQGFTPLVVRDADVGVDDAVRSYLFNSQLVELPGEQGICLIAPEECREIDGVRRWIEREVHEGAPIARARFFDLRQSMRNGGGPACLRLRVVLTDEERAAVNQNCLMSSSVCAALTDWVSRRYRDRLAPADLADPALLRESREALDELTRILDLGSLYDFQRE